MSDADTLNRLLSTFRRSAWRLEARDRYEADADLHAYLRGDPLPPPIDAVFAAYLDNLRAMPGQGRSSARVHALVGPLTPYLRYEVEWGYARTADAGDEVRILHRQSWAETPFGEPPPDFWLFDVELPDPTVALMHYAPDGAWRGLEVVSGDLAEYLWLREAAIRDSIPLRDYLAVLRATPIDPSSALHPPAERIAS
ncbi:MAG: DUF6879 family protein [Thermoplasmata archaeon]